MTIDKRLLDAVEKIYKLAGLSLVKPPIAEAESAEYAASRLVLNGKNIVFRAAKTTPTKVGQFVTLWKRVAGKTAPFDDSDNIDFVIVQTSHGSQEGQFILSKQTLIQQGIMSSGKKTGKMAIRVYPPSVKVPSDQAEKTQRWQTKCFLPIAADGQADISLVCKLFNLAPQSQATSTSQRSMFKRKLDDEPALSDDGLPSPPEKKTK